MKKENLHQPFEISVKELEESPLKEHEHTFFELVKERHSVRHYAQQVVEKEKLDYILDCARLAPSAVNKQPWTFIVVQSDSQKQKLAKCYPAKWFTEAPVYIVVCVNTDIAWKRQFDNKNHADIDGAKLLSIFV